MTHVPGPLTLDEDDRRVLAPWAASCAEGVLPLFEAVAPGDPRPREAIAGVRAFARGELRIGPVRALAVAAHAAARSVDDAAAVAAARAAGHAAATAHMAAHARGVPAYAAIATLAARAAARAAPPAAAADVAAPGGPAASAEIGKALAHASPAVREVLRRLPAPARSAGTLGRLIAELHAGVVAET